MMHVNQAWSEWDMETITYYYSPCSASHDTHPYGEDPINQHEPQGLESMTRE